MPRTFTNSEKQQRKIIRELTGAAKGHQKELAEVWGISRQAVSKRLNTGNVTLFDLWLARDLMDLDANDLIGERKSNG